MKKVLLGTSAIALAGAFASQANAVEWEVRVGGYMEQYAAFQDPDVNVVTGKDTFLFDPAIDPTLGVTGFQDGMYDSLSRSNPDFDGIDSKTDTEVHFLPKIVLDNGLEIGADIQLEGFSSGSQIDESFLRIKGSFGEVNLGSENSAGYKMTYAAPDVTFVNVNSGSLTAFIPVSGFGGDDIFRGTLGASFIETLRNSDIQRFTYYTPRFAGFQVGVSYGRDNTEQSNASLDCDTNTCDFFDVGANYVNSFGAFNVALSGRYGWADVPGGGGNPEVWAAGLNLGYGGFTVGGSYADSDADHGVQEGEFWDVGIAYETGPWGFSFTYSRGENVDNDCFGSAVDTLLETGPTPVNNCSGGNDEELEQYLAGISYALARGVSLNGFGGYVDFEGATVTSLDGDSGNTDIDGWVVGTGIKISW